LRAVLDERLVDDGGVDGLLGSEHGSARVESGEGEPALGRIDGDDAHRQLLARLDVIPGAPDRARHYQSQTLF
jgi:hypothetical protein